MSGIMHVGRLERKFVFESAGTTPNDKLRYNDPSFLTFRLLFDFEPLNNDNEVTQGLLLSEDRDESAISYLRRTGEQGKGEALREFRWMLSRISDDFPWFFKDISGADGLWKWGQLKTDERGGSSVDNGDVNLTVNCYETVDMRMTALADLYRKASWDRLYFREVLPVNKRRFNMTLVVGEARYLKTFVQQERNSLRPDWLNYVSAVAFRCLDCEFDFNSSFPGKNVKSDSYAEASLSFNIKVGRVQEANSYKLLNYMLGEMKRDLIIKQGGSGASYNDNRDLINYRSFLAPLIREYENNYEAVVSSKENNIRDYFLGGVEFSSADNIESLPRQTRNSIRKAQLDASDSSESKDALGRSIMNSIIESAGITRQEPRLLEFGVPKVDKGIEPSVQFTEARKSVDIESSVEFEEPKLDETMPNQVQFAKPTVDTGLSAVNLSKPKVETKFGNNVQLQKPKIDSALSNIQQVAPTVATDLNDVKFSVPTVENELSLVELKSPTVENGNTSDVVFNIPTVDKKLTSDVELNASTIDSVIGNVSFQVPTVANIGDSENLVNFGVPTVLTSGSLANVKLQPASYDSKLLGSVSFDKPKVEDDFGS